MSEAVLYIHKQDVYKREYPRQALSIIFFHLFLKLGFASTQRRKWKVKQLCECKSILHHGSLTNEEYANLFIVFQNAFADQSFDEFDTFLCEVIHISLSPNVVAFDYDLITPYIHLIKMLDASQLLRGRGLEKIKKNISLLE